MSLLQISEPTAVVPQKKRIAIGIDLGTTHSLVATVQEGAASVLLDTEGRALLPSVVYYSAEGKAAVGAEALEHLTEAPADTITSVKRWMGRSVSDINPSTLPYHFLDTAGMLRVQLSCGIKSPVEISAAILRALRQRAESALGALIEGAVITVPAYFDEAQRQATKDAAQLAGLTVLRLLNEPTAAAIAYGLEQRATGTFIVFDLGGGTFDVSLLTLEGGIFRVRAINGDAALGGDDFDAVLYQQALQQRAQPPLSAQDRRSLWLAARTARETLTDAEHTVFKALLQTGDTLEFPLTRSDLVRWTQPLIDRMAALLKQTLQDAALASHQIDEVVVVGGASRMPHVQQMIQTFFGRPPFTALDPEQAVALGAAKQADLLIGNQREDWLLLDVIPLSLGLETMGGLVEKIIPRHAPLPIARAQEFTTFKDGQQSMKIHVLQGERERVSDCRSLAEFTLREIPPMPAGTARIEVVFQVDVDGLLSVKATERTTQCSTSIEIKPSYGLSTEEIAQLIRESGSHAAEDTQARARAEAQLDAERLIDATRTALDEQGKQLLNEAEHKLIIDTLQQLVLIPHTADTATLREAIKRLSEATEVFAARRMNASIQQRLKGRSVNQL